MTKAPPDWETEREWLYAEASERMWAERRREQGWVLAVLLAWTAGLLVGWLFFP